MNQDKQTSAAAVVMSFILAIAAASISGLADYEVLGQQQNATNATATMSNQTGSTAQNQTSTMINLTQSDHILLSSIALLCCNK